MNVAVGRRPRRRRRHPPSNQHPTTWNRIFQYRKEAFHILLVRLFSPLPNSHTVTPQEEGFYVPQAFGDWILPPSLNRLSHRSPDYWVVAKGRQKRPLSPLCSKQATPLLPYSYMSTHRGLFNCLIRSFPALYLTEGRLPSFQGLLRPREVLMRAYAFPPLTPGTYHTLHFKNSHHHIRDVLMGE